VSSRPSDTGIGRSLSPIEGRSLSRSLRFSKGEGRSLSSPKGDLSPVECNFFRWIYPFITMAFFNLPKYRVYLSFHGSFLVYTYFRTKQNRFHRKRVAIWQPFSIRKCNFLFRNFAQSIGQCCPSQIHPNNFSISIDQIIGRNGTNAPSCTNIRSPTFQITHVVRPC